LKERYQLPLMGSLLIIATMMHPNVSLLSIAPHSEAKPGACWAWLKTEPGSLDHLNLTCCIVGMRR
jgi:hypothetical protein